MLRFQPRAKSPPGSSRLAIAGNLLPAIGRAAQERSGSSSSRRRASPTSRRSLNMNASIATAAIGCEGRSSVKCWRTALSAPICAKAATAAGFPAGEARQPRSTLLSTLNDQLSRKTWGNHPIARRVGDANFTPNCDSTRQGGGFCGTTVSGSAMGRSFCFG